VKTGRSKARVFFLRRLRPLKEDACAARQEGSGCRSSRDRQDTILLVDLTKESLTLSLREENVVLFRFCLRIVDGLVSRTKAPFSGGL